MLTKLGIACLAGLVVVISMLFNSEAVRGKFTTSEISSTKWGHEEPEILNSTHPSDRLQRSSGARHLEAIPDGYFNYTDVYAKFTDPLPIFENPSAYWSGEWTAAPVSSTNNRFLKGFSRSTGKVDIYFEYIPRIKKHIAYIKIMDGPYVDSRRSTLMVNLKMSTFDPDNATFKLNKPVNTEHHASADIVFDTLEKETVEYFDIDFELRVRSPNNADQPVANLTTFQDYLKTSLQATVSSKQLGLNLKFSAASASKPTPSTWLAVLVPIVVAAAMITSFVCMVLLSEGRNITFVNNVGFESFGLFSLFYFHLFIVYITLATRLETYKMSYYILSTIFMAKSFMSMVAFFVAMSVDNGLIHRGERPKAYYFMSVVIFCVVAIIISLLMPKYVFSKNYTKYLMAFYFYPLLQLIIVYYRRKGKKVFDVKFQVVIWGVVSLVGIGQRGLYHPFLNLEADIRVVYAAIGCPLAIGFLMHLMSKHGLYFFLPEFLTPDTINYKVPVSKFTQEKLDDFCCVCQGKLKYDPEVAPDEQVRELNDLSDSGLFKKSEVLFKAPCQHTFHIVCIEGWLEKQRLCPMCKMEIPETIE